LNFKDYEKYRKEQIMMKQCRLPMEDGGAWHVQRVGPFVSTGGYDWWSIAFPNVGLLEEALAKHPEGIEVIREAFTPVLKDGTRLGYPPIHTHHIHSLPQPGVRPRLMPRPMCLQSSGLGIPLLDDLVSEVNCQNMSMHFEQHGDHICQPEDDGLDCLTQGDRNTRRLVAPLDVEGELNDVRPAGSEPLEWYYQIAMRWRPVRPEEPVVSQLVILNPGQIIPPHQMTRAFTAPTPTHAQSVMLFSSPYTAGGEMRRVKVHAHSVICESMMLLRGEFSDFGLGDTKFIPAHAWQPLVTTQLGFRDNEDLAQHILYHMGLSQAYYDQACLDAKGQPKAGGLRNPVCRRPRPDWMCGAKADSAEVVFEGVAYVFDRRAKCQCKPYTFEAGETFVAVGFNRQVTRPVTPSAPGRVPPSVGQHTSFIVSYVDRTRGHSYLDVQLSNRNGIFYDMHHRLTLPALLARMVGVILWSGPVNDTSTFDFIAWLFTALFTALALYLGSWLLWGARKVPQVDRALCLLQEALTTFFVPSHKPDWTAAAARSAVAAAENGHSYEMVRLTEDADGAGPAAEERDL
jgi:hypothetical protein